jgi:hypothetical protein
MCPGMYLADRFVLHLVATVMSFFGIVPLEGKKLPDPNKVEWSATAMQYVIIISVLQYDIFLTINMPQAPAWL